MRTQKLILNATLLVTLTIGLMTTSCKKHENKTEKEDNNESVADGASTEKSFDDANSIADQANDASGLSSYRTSSTMISESIMSTCATLTKDTVNKVITIDFGTTNCTCNDGRTRRGKIIVNYTGKYRETGSVHTITFDNYFVNDNQLTGTKTVTNNGPNAAGNISFSINVNGTLIKANNGGTVTWISTRTREWIAGSTTPAWSDDVYLITGSASGTSAQGVSFTTNITTPLRREIGCKWFVSGVVEHTPQNKPMRKLDYGTGACDDQAVVTRGNQTKTITLH